jgi:hypothetical protein
MEEYGRRLLAELYAWKNMAEGCWLSSKYERAEANLCAWKKMSKRLLDELCAWKYMEEGYRLRHVYGGIW